MHLKQLDGFQFLVKFDKEQFEPLRLDEPPPLGHDTAPNAARILAAAIGNRLSASLVFCLTCFRLSVRASASREFRSDGLTLAAGSQRMASGGDRNMTDVTYQMALGGPIVLVAQVEGFGPVEVKTSRKGIFSCRVSDRHAREAALQAVEAFADEHEAELQVLYDQIAELWAAPRVA